MYGKKRIVLSKRPARDTGAQQIYQKGNKSSAPIGVWYQQDGRYYANLRSAEQRYKLISSRELAIKGFGGCSTVTELRDAIRDLRMTTGEW